MHKISLAFLCILPIDNCLKVCYTIGTIKKGVRAMPIEWFDTITEEEIEMLLNDVNPHI